MLLKEVLTLNEQFTQKNENLLKMYLSSGHPRCR